MSQSASDMVFTKLKYVILIDFIEAGSRIYIRDQKCVANFLKSLHRCFFVRRVKFLTRGSQTPILRNKHAKNNISKKSKIELET